MPRAAVVYQKDQPMKVEDIVLRPIADHEVLVNVKACGVCHSDLHTARGEWGNTTYPVVPGHEIVGRVTNVGDHVKKFKVGDLL